MELESDSEAMGLLSRQEEPQRSKWTTGLRLLATVSAGLLLLAVAVSASPTNLRAAGQNIIDLVKKPNLKKLLASEAAQAAQATQAPCPPVGSMPTFSGPDDSSPPLKVHVLSYNLFWWSLFGKRHGNGGSAGKLIADAHNEEPFDILAFQECGDGTWPMKDAGLTDDFHLFQGAQAKCMAFRKASWTLIASGEAEVAADAWWNNYGKRGIQWMRLKHTNGRFLFFANHHGPLSINAGGLCGGEATANSILSSIKRNTEAGDAIILAGDFNANAASLTIQTLRKSLVHAYNGVSFGGIDNFFTNAPGSSVVGTKNLGSGGSDHDAIAVTIQFGGGDAHTAQAPAAVAAVQALSGPGAPLNEWEHFWCGLQENNMQYTVSVPDGGWTKTEEKSPSPDWCCRSCQAEPNCQSFIWVGGQQAGAKECRMYGALPAGKLPATDFVSGLAAPAAAHAASLVKPLQSL